MCTSAFVLLALGPLACRAAPPPESPPPPAVLAPAPVEPATAPEPSPSVSAKASPPVEATPPADDEPLDPNATWSDEVMLGPSHLVVTGRLPPDVVHRVVQRERYAAIRHCVEQAKPRRETRMTATFTIDASGSVGSDLKVKTEPADSGLAACVTPHFVNLSFPRPAAGSVSVTYPVVAMRERVPKVVAGKRAKKTVDDDDGAGLVEATGFRSIGLPGASPPPGAAKPTAPKRK